MDALAISPQRQGPGKLHSGGRGGLAPSSASATPASGRWLWGIPGEEGGGRGWREWQFPLYLCPRSEKDMGRPGGGALRAGEARKGGLLTRM